MASPSGGRHPQPRPGRLNAENGMPSGVGLAAENQSLRGKIPAPTGIGTDSPSKVTKLGHQTFSPAKQTGVVLTRLPANARRKTPQLALIGVNARLPRTVR